MPAKSLRAVLQREMARFLEEHGYPLTASDDRKARCRELEAPLVGMVSPVIEGHRYGGASLTAHVLIVAEPSAGVHGRDLTAGLGADAATR